MPRREPFERYVDLLHRHHRLERAFGFSATGRKRLDQRARGDLPGKAPAILAPTALAFLAPVADDGVPIAVGFVLIVRRDLEREGFAVPELRSTVETEAGDAHDGELHGEHFVLPAARVVSGRLVNGGHLTVGKRGGVEARRFLRVLVEPEADRVLRFQGGALLL